MKRVFILFLTPLLLLSGPVNAQYEIPHGTFGCGGSVRSGDVIVYDTCGQAAGAEMGGASHTVGLGFWYLAGLASAVDAAMVSFEAEYSEEMVRLRWTANPDNPPDGYDIYRSEGEQEDFRRINPETVDGGRGMREYSDRTTIPGRGYSYYISAVKGGVEVFRSETVKLNLPPKPLTLYQNFPNPFNPSTTIRMFLPERSRISLEIFDVTGRWINTLAEGIRAAGRYETEWNGRDSRGRDVSSGVYYYRLTADKEIITRKLVLMR